MTQVVVAVLVGLLLFWVGMALLRFLGRTPPGPPPEGEMRKVDFRYECSICGAAVRMTLAADADPDPPRHCQEDMVLVASPLED